MPTRNKEIKPPPELVEAIQAAPDGVAPPSANASGAEFSHDVPRAERIRLMHETPQRLEEHQGRDHRVGLSREDKQALLAEQHAQEHAPQYDRSHVTAGKQGQGTAQVDSAIGIGRHDRNIADGGRFSYHMHNKQKGAHGRE